MRILLSDANDDKVVAEFKIEVTDRSYILIPYIHDESFSHLLEDLVFIKTKWMTYCLNYMVYDDITKDPDEMLKGLVQDILEMLEHEIIFQRRMEMGSYKITCHEV